MQKRGQTIYFQIIFQCIFWALVALVTTLLLMEHYGNIIGFPHMDKIIHAILFASLTITGYLAYSKHPVSLYIGLAIYGILTELSQAAFTVTRFASIYDWMADIAGIALAIFIINFIKSRTTLKKLYVH